MCLSIALERPEDVLAAGTHAGHEWQVIHNGSGYRCGYVKVPPGHPGTASIPARSMLAPDPQRRGQPLGADRR